MTGNVAETSWCLAVLCFLTAACGGGGDGEDVGLEDVFELDTVSDGDEGDAPDVPDGADHDVADPVDVSEDREEIEIGETVTINSGNVVGTNVFGPGIQLENRIVSRWVDNPAYGQLAAEGGVKLVRFFEHRTSGVGGICSSWDAGSMSCRSWDWEDIDDTVERIFESGGEPLIVLGFYSFTGENDRISSVPTDMPLDPATAYPPDSQGLPQAAHFGAYCAAWVRHFNEMGAPWNQTRYYEIVNEPNHYFGWGDYAEEEKIGHYMNLYNAAALAMRSENPNVRLGNDNCMFKKVLDAFIADGEELDFLSYHGYATGDYDTPDADILDEAETRELDEDRNTYGVVRSRELYFEERGLALPVINSENNINWRFGDGSDPRIQQMLGAAYVALQVRTSMLFDIESFVYFHYMSSKSAQEVEPTGGFGFGMINSDDDRPWFPYYVYALVGPNLAGGDPIIESQSSLDDVRVVAWINGGAVNVLLVNRVNEERTVHVLGLPGELSFSKIDDPTGTAFLDPGVQEGTVSEAAPIVLDGYTVMLLRGS